MAQGPTGPWATAGLQAEVGLGRLHAHWNSLAPTPSIRLWHIRTHTHVCFPDCHPIFPDGHLFFPIAGCSAAKNRVGCKRGPGTNRSLGRTSLQAEVGLVAAREWQP